MPKQPKKPNERIPDQQPREDVDFYLHTDKPHKKWFSHQALGRYGDSRGHKQFEHTKQKLSARRKPKGKQEK